MKIKRRKNESFKFNARLYLFLKQYEKVNYWTDGVM